MHQAKFLFLLNIGAILWSTMNCIHGWKLYLQFIFFAYGVYASRINSALIGVTLLLVKRKSRCYVMKLRPYMTFIGFFTPGVLVLIMLVVVQHETPKHGDKVNKVIIKTKQQQHFQLSANGIVQSSLFTLHCTSNFLKKLSLYYQTILRK